LPASREPAAASTGRYRVQLASVSSEALAKREWARLQKAFPDLLGEQTLIVEQKAIAGRGTFYRVQTGGYETLTDARAVCNGLKAKKQACLPIKR
jgi:septal ring-binding cell division protein DamX